MPLRWSRRENVAGIGCAIAALMLGIIGIDLLTFIMPGFGRTGMSGTWNPSKLAWMAALSLLTAILCGMNAWRLCRPASRQRAVANKWSPLAVLVWWVLALLCPLVYYPLPYFNHHIDKFVLFVSAILLWATWLYVRPDGLNRWLESYAFRWIWVLMINALVFLALAEGAVRFVDPYLARSGLFSAAPDTPGGGIPFHVTDRTGMRTNSMGFRDRERTLKRRSTALRLVALGDSFTWGTGAIYDEAFVTLVERGLSSMSPNAEVINLGMVGYQPHEYLALLKAHGLAYHPDAILMNFFVGNDLMPAQGAQLIVAGHRHRVHINGNWFHDHFSWDHWYLSHDLAYTWLGGEAAIRRVSGMSNLGALSQKSASIDDGEAVTTFSGWSPQYLRMIQGMSDQFLKRDTSDFLARWRETSRTLDRVNALLVERGIPWVLVLLPAEEQVDVELQRLYVSMNGGRPEAYDFRKPQRLLAEWGKQQGVKVIDLGPEFQANAARGRLFIDNDIHWNKNGHALAAQIVTRELSRGLPKTRVMDISGPASAVR